ncbi:MAG: MurR/RpiR family transcriptional regulator [Spirochaetaceae bacterium]
MNGWHERLQNSEHDLSRTERALISFINRRPELAVRLTQQELAIEASVSKPVVINCFRKLGYESFREFQGGLEQFFSTHIDSLSASRKVTEHVHSLEELIREAVAVDTRALQRLRDAIDPSVLKHIARRMHDARVTVIMGRSTGDYPAHYLWQRLSRYGLQTSLISHDERHLAEGLHMVGPEDVLFLFHYSDDDTWLYQVERVCADRGIWTVLVSTSIHPDYVKAVDLFVHVPRGELGFKNSMAVPMHFANLVLLAYEFVYRTEVDEHLTTLESTRRVVDSVSGEKRNGKE